MAFSKSAKTVIILPMKRFLKFFIGLALLPVCYGYSVEFLRVLQTIFTMPGNYWFLFTGGGAAYLLIHLFLPRPLLLQVFGHELTHAVFAKLFGWRVNSFTASNSGGRVKLSGSNFIVTLAPYFFPLYSFIILFIYTVAIMLGYGSRYYPYFLFLTGFTLSLHILMTLESLRTEQPDIKESGLVFSVPLIYLGNLTMITLLLRLTIFKNIDYSGYLKTGLLRSWEVWKALYRAAVG